MMGKPKSEPDERTGETRNPLSDLRLMVSEAGPDQTNPHCESVRVNGVMESDLTRRVLSRAFREARRACGVPPPPLADRFRPRRPRCV